MRVSHEKFTAKERVDRIDVFMNTWLQTPQPRHPVIRSFSKIVLFQKA